MEKIVPNTLTTTATVKHGSRFKDLTGQRFGKLVAVEFLGTVKKKGSVWKCHCDCGGKKDVSRTHLSRGNTSSCGCLIKERAVRQIIHGCSRRGIRNPEYSSWIGMKQRCYNPRNAKYKNYGGRGITVSVEWIDSFETFLRDMGKKPGPKYTIERVNNNGNYEPSNCVWATNAEQSNNRRSNHILEYNGERKNMTQWAKVTGLSRDVIKIRLKLGWSIDEALTARVA